MKKFISLHFLFILTSLVIFTSCNNDDDPPTPDPAPEAKTYEVTMNDNSKTPSISGTVTTTDGTAKLRLNVVSSTDLDQIFVMRSQDNGDLTPIAFTAITTGGKTFSAGTTTSYSLKVPASTQSFVIDLPVSIRSTSAAVTDVYYIWITNGSGSFTKPTKNTVLGPAVVTLKYTAAAVVPYSTATLNVGTQSALQNSFLVTSGQVSALSTADYNDAPQSADIRFVSLDGSGKKNNTATNVYMYSPADVTAANPPSDASIDFTAAAGSRATSFVAYSAKAFTDVNGTDLQNISFAAATNNILITQGNTYAFKTQAGKIGVIYINSVTADTDATNAGGVNANVSIKVLN